VMDPFELNLNHLAHFHVVAERGSLKNAGERLKVAPSTLSEQMRALEEALGRDLFDRTGGRLRANAHGRRVRRRTAKIVDALDELLRDLDLDRDDHPPVVSVGVSAAVTHALVADFFMPLFERDSLHVRIQHGSYDDLLRMLLARELDLVFSEDTPADPMTKALAVRRVSQPPLVGLAAPALAARLEGEFPECLDGAPFLSFPEGSLYRWHIDDFLVTEGIHVEAVGEVADVGLMYAAVEQGHCVAFLPVPLARSDGLTELGRLPEAPAGVSAIFHAADPDQPVFAAIEHLLDQVGATAV